MPKGIPNKKYTGELKQKLVELVRNGGLSQREVSTQYGVSRYSLQLWERIYLEEGPEGLYVERRGRGSKGGGRPRSSSSRRSKRISSPKYKGFDRRMHT